MGGVQINICMPRCELCGSNADSLTTTKISSAEMDVCSSCTDHGTVVEDQEQEEQTTKYDTDTTTTQNTSNTKTTISQSSTDSTEDFSALPPDYGDRIQEERESEGISRGELASQLQEKESLLRRIENNETQPTKRLQRKLENALGLDLSETDTNSSFETDDSGNNLTIGDVIERK
jgi:uncharacterized protein (TIGR00270 family)